MTNNEQLLSDTLTILNNLFKVIDSLRGIFIDPDFQGSFQDLDNEYKQAIDKLENPTLSIVMIGLTSSGKSTIINALIGRKIAPTANEEKTAGILTIKHSDTSFLCINGKERGEALNDKSLYQIIETEMKEYAKNRNDQSLNRNDQSLMITVSVPLLFVCNPELLGLPPKIKVELIDLPGIRTSDDEDSINLFKEKGNKAFIIVALDYQNNTDEVKRKKLLTQLKPNLDLLNGKTDSLFFILNKFNLRKQEDEPLDTSIRKLQDSVRGCFKSQSELKIMLIAEP
ncbi:dynamin family protein [Aetokthonos hydrillicola Thurmond2011]|jgi:ribosome biogenesis GTPase A|uniref:Dynamin family protein n=1 Tax=Aetokthonos hydrillicola Thurmond2011 TaxID=2712845 RepID=A0AAP5I717_9CYAN|nr:dynamin family protein [Aetokthonos hydrillicola]MBO3459299.1 hypothetical protein [Aetokthonos hydrillicola CCALA 1050]MBW4587725.1 dynamin family protein [Aetokthonos hydrillicola CCALA 1050]MDR9894373.1 dynamin family protein [Aetokthonos hydrillicola Thurmond2011]